MRGPRALATLLFAFALTPSTTLGQVPTPESVLGYPVGSDFELANYEQSIAYFEALDAASDRIELREIGRTSFGRPSYIALISSAENLRDVERYREIAQQLAYPSDDMTDDDARRLAAEGKAIVHIDGGMHASEVAHAQHTIQLAYDLVTGDDDPEIAAILDNVILLLWPSINPDGQTMISDWYYSNLGTQYEVASAPFLYQKYVGHDNNRDGYAINQIESRTVTRVDRHWEPQIIYNHHQTAPFPARIWIPPFAEPVSPNVHPLVWRTVNLVGMAMAQGLEERGQKGAVHQIVFDNWYPGLRRPRELLSQRRLLPHRDGAVPVRDAALLYGLGLSCEPSRPASAVAVRLAVGRGMVADRGCSVVHADRFGHGSGRRSEVPARLAVQPLSGCA